MYIKSYEYTRAYEWLWMCNIYISYIIVLYLYYIYYYIYIVHVCAYRASEIVLDQIRLERKMSKYVKPPHLKGKDFAFVRRSLGVQLQQANLPSGNGCAWLSIGFASLLDFRIKIWTFVGKLLKIFKKKCWSFQVFTCVHHQLSPETFVPRGCLCGWPSLVCTSGNAHRSLEPAAKAGVTKSPIYSNQVGWPH